MTVNSAIFIIKQYGIPVPLDQSLCNYVYAGRAVFSCLTISGQTHVVDITSILLPYVNKGDPDYTLTSLYFPSLESIGLIPTVYPSLRYLVLGFYPTDELIQFSKSKMPILESVDFAIGDGSKLHFGSDIAITYLSCYGLPRGIQNIQCTLSIGDPSKMNTLVVHGRNSSFSPPVSPSFKVLKMLTIKFLNITTYPISFTFPPLMESLAFENTQITQVPNIQLPSSVKVLSILFNNVAGTVDYDYVFANSTNLQLYLQSPLIVGSIPDSFCDNRPFVFGTSISSIPDCFWCYSGDNSIFTTSAIKPPTITCDIGLDSTFLVTKNGKITVTGRGLGWGAPDIKAIIPNRQMEITYPSFALLEPPKNVTFNLQNVGPVVSVQAEIAEGGVTINDVRFSQMANYVEVRMYMYNYNPYFVPLVQFNEMAALSSGMTVNKTMITFAVPPMQSRQCYINVNNQYYQANWGTYFFKTFPTITNISTLSSPGTPITIIGNTGGFANSVIQVTFNNGTLSETDCLVSNYTSTYIICSTPITLPGVYGNTSVRVNVNGFFTFSSVVLKSVQTYCQETTNYCHGNGDCNESGICLCKQSNFYDSCSKSYPTLSSGQYDSNDLTMVSLYGDFGPLPTLTNVSIKLNNSISCTPTIVSQSSISCTLSSNAPFGLSSAQVVQVSSDTSNSSSDENGGETAQQKCSRLTFNCFGNGICDTNGICVCNQNYNPIDHCFTKFINTTIIANSTSPTVSFDVDGLDFQFEFKSIQELDLDNNVLNLLNIDDYSWNVNVSINDINTTAVYQLNTTNTTNSNNNSTSQFNPFQSLQVSSTISFSSQPREIPFGDQVLQINPNSIKLAINVSGWQYSSNVATLRLIFTSVVNQNQSIEFNCEKTEIGTLSFDSLSNLQYLRVVKDNIQFNGRFIDYAISDGRVVYSQTELVSFTPIDDKDNDNDGQSIATIGIRLPQCQECLLDPDFTPLLIDKSNDQGCGESSSKAWKIAVGVVVGAGAAIAIAAATVILVLKKRKATIFQKKMDRLSFNQ
ncbi:EGF-like protein [Cavenderia fasciculata]|uniref:EGF-like protein n=1 Tax=Cavenderia fasciculata TaxID=261658 RepID=F4Q6W9_CACFS|nr:EGF-like protein [Cavenderia fasciculata]EGG16151.1 EGF-like protein [Cavenderia fasciculata]|eukprot:XP_004352604.1 EGF-like protein [Cavenderia fasciculata]